MRTKKCVVLLALGVLVAGTLFAGEVIFKDPTGDDDGPGTYTYPTDVVYTPGSFDLTELKITPKGKNLQIAVSVNAKLEDPWRMGTGFSVQMFFVFIDTDGKEGSGFTTGLPGTNVKFAPDSAWDRCIILSPQPSARVKQEVRTKAGDMADAIIVPNRVSGSGRTVSATVKLADIGEGDPAKWGYQVIVQSNEGFPAKTDLLTRKVNEFEGQHRFGGGSDYDCDPHVMDILAGAAKGGEDEIEAQHKMLAYKCDDEGNAVQMATLHMVHQ